MTDLSRAARPKLSLTRSAANADTIDASCEERPRERRPTVEKSAEVIRLHSDEGARRHPQAARLPSSPTPPPLCADTILQSVCTHFDITDDGVDDLAAFTRRMLEGSRQRHA